MPARDQFHDAARNGLIKDGWTITADLLIIEFFGINMYISFNSPFQRWHTEFAVG